MRLHWPLVNLALLFIIPIIAAAYMLLFTDPHNLNTVQHGTFIERPQQLELDDIAYIDGEDRSQKWTLVYIEPTICSTACEEQKAVLHNIYTALGAQRDRVAVVTAKPQIGVLEILPNDLLILNPQGLFIMHYSDLVAHSGLLKDLRRLLKYSHA